VAVATIVHLSRKYYEGLSGLPIGVPCQPCPRRGSLTRLATVAGTNGISRFSRLDFSNIASGSLDSAVVHLGNLPFSRAKPIVGLPLVRTKVRHTEKRIFGSSIPGLRFPRTDAQHDVVTGSRHLPAGSRKSMATRSSLRNFLLYPKRFIPAHPEPI